MSALIDRANAVLGLLQEAREAATKSEWTAHHLERVSYIASKTKLADVFSESFGDRSNKEANARSIVLRHNGWQADEELVRGLLRVGCEASANGARDCSSGDYLKCWWCGSIERWTSFWEKELGVGQ